jgi:lipopolysaccharide transport system ATP-binding protein
MKDVSSKEGRTVLFVSHNMQAISNLTTKCIFMSNGELVQIGRTKDIINKYLLYGTSNDIVYNCAPDILSPRITKVTLETTEPNNTQINGENMKVIIEINSPISIQGAALSLQFLNSMHVPIVQLWLYDSQIPFCREPGVFQLVCTIPSLRLYMGKYSLSIHFSDFNSGIKWDFIEEICPFEVVMFGKSRDYKWEDGACAYIEDFIWTLNKSN